MGAKQQPPPEATTMITKHILSGQQKTAEKWQFSQISQICFKVLGNKTNLVVF